MYSSLIILAIRVPTLSPSKRTRRTFKSSTNHEKNNEFIFDEEHMIEFLKCLKQQSFDDHSNLLEILTSKCFSLLIKSQFLSI